MTFELDYPERLSRWSTFFRFLLLTVLIMPIVYAAFLMMTLSAIPLIAWVSLMSNGRYPRMLFPISVWIQRLSAQLSAYAYLVTDEFPFDQRDRPVRFDIEYTSPHRRLGVFFRPILIIPHIIVLALLWLLQYLVTIVGWFAILLTGNYPRGLWKFSVGVLRWNARVGAYLGLPDRSLSPIQPVLAADVRHTA